MPRAKKAAVEVLPPEEPVTIATPKPPPPVAEETHRVVRTWKTAVPVQAGDDEGDEWTDEDEDDDDDAPEPEIIAPGPVDPFEAILTEIGVSAAAYSIAVNRLPSYDRDQRTDQKSRVFCGILTVPDVEYLREERYREEIQLKWARPNKSNHFFCQIRRNNRVSVALPAPVSVEPLAPNELAEKAHDNPAIMPNFNFTAPAQPDSFDSFIKGASKLQALGILPNFTAAGATGPQARAPEPPLTDEKAILHLAMTDDATRKRVFGGFRSLLGNAEKETGVYDIVLALIENAGPILEKAATIWRDTIAPRPMPGAPGMQAPPFPMQQNGAAMQTAPPQAPPPPGPDAILLTFLIQSLAERRPVSGVAVAIEAQIEQTPELGPLVDSMLNAPAQEVLDWLARVAPQAELVANAPGAAEWIESLQLALTKESDPEQVQ